MRRFRLGHLYNISHPARDALAGKGINPMTLIQRHRTGDWGDICPEDWQANDEAVRNGSRLLSAYVLDDIKVWVITEADRRITTILLPRDY